MLSIKKVKKKIQGATFEQLKRNTSIVLNKSNFLK